MNRQQRPFARHEPVSTHDSPGLGKGGGYICAIRAVCIVAEHAILVEFKRIYIDHLCGFFISSPKSSQNVFQIYLKCISNVSQMYFKFISNVSQMYLKCISNVSQMYLKFLDQNDISPSGRRLQKNPKTPFLIDEHFSIPRGVASVFRLRSSSDSMKKKWTQCRFFLCWFL